MRFRCRFPALAVGLLLISLVSGSSGCSSMSGCHSVGCGVGLGRPLLARLSPCRDCGVVVGSTSHVIQNQPCDCSCECEPSCHFTLRNWPFSFRLFNRCESCSEPITYVAPQPLPAQHVPASDKPAEQKSPEPIRMPPAPGAPATRPMAASPHQVQPDLAVNLSSPVRRYVGKVIDQTLVVFNHGRAPATEVELIHKLPEELKVEMASGEGQVAGNEVKWALGTIPPEGSRTVTVQARGTTVAPEVIAQASVKAKEGVTATTSATMEIHGSSGIMLKVFDLADPVPVGNELDYLVQVTNTGTVPALDLRLRIDCPEEIQPVSFTNAPEIIARGQKIEIPAFDLAACGTKMFRLRVHAVKAGDLRFRVYLEGQDLKHAIMEEESTRIYNGK